ncbi:MAG: transposase [Parachlamydiaceae bacterium]
MLNKELLTVGLFECNIDTAVFTVWVKQELLPALPSKSVIVMDNASFHKGKLMREAIESNRHTLEYLPPYSPDLNPIEQKWAQAKLLRRKNNCCIDQLFNRHNL